MSYDLTTLTEVKLLKDIASVDTTDDSLLSSFITIASKLIVDICHQEIVALNQTRYFHGITDVEGNDLLVDTGLVSVTGITNGNGNTITSGQYVFLPANYTPHYGIRLKASSGVTWTYVTDPENAISVTGLWGYSEGTPTPVNYACQRIVSWMYGLRDNPFYQLGVTEAGFPVLAQNLPADIQVSLAPYVRNTLR